MKQDEFQLPNRSGSMGPTSNIQLSSYRRYQSALAFENPVFSEETDGQQNEQKSVGTVANVNDVDSKNPYEPHDFGNTHNPTSYWDTVLHLVIIIAGPSVLSIPSTFVGAGYVISIILVPSLFCLYIHNINMVVWSEYHLCKVRRIPALSYPEVAYYAFQDGPSYTQFFAKWTQMLVYVDFLFVWFSYYCYNYVIMCQNLQVLLSNMFQLQVSVDVLIQILLIPQLLLACIPQLKYLVPFSFFGNVFNVTSMVLIVYFIFSDNSPWQIPPTFGPLRNIPLFIGTVIVNLNIMGIMLPLKNEMKKPKKFASSFGAIMVSYMSVTVVYTGFSLISALKYGNNIQPSVIQNLPQTNLIAQIGIGLSSLSLLCQQPLIIRVPYDIIWNQILKNKFRDYHSTIWECFIRMFLVVITCAISLAVPNVFVFISLAGTIGTSIDSLILPALIHTAVARKFCQTELKFWLVFFKNMAIIFLAIILVITGGIDSVSEVIDIYSGKS